MNTRDTFSSKIGIIAAAAGSAIGLGNIWKFPYMAGQNGGSAFIFIYLIAVVLMGYPLIYTEFIIGRHTGVNAIDAFGKLTGKKSAKIIGYIGVITVFLVATFYAMIAGWVMYYFVQSLSGTLYNIPNLSGTLSNEVIRNHYDTVFANMNASVILPLLGSILAIILTGTVNFFGIKDGIEKFSKILMPILFLIFIGLIGYSMTLDGFGSAVTFLFKPDFSCLTPMVVIQAIGQAFFSLSLGMGLLITYGSYVSKEENILAISKQVVIADTLIGLFSGLLIFPAVFTFGGSTEAGPALLFKALPTVFVQMPGGRWFGTLFFLLVIVAAITSLISIFEIIISCLSEKANLSRHKATIVVVIATMIGAGVNVLGEGPWSSFTIGGQTIFGALDYLTNNITIPLVGALTAIVATWFWKRSEFTKELTSASKHGKTDSTFFYYMLKYAIPPVIIILIIALLFG